MMTQHTNFKNKSLKLKTMIFSNKSFKKSIISRDSISLILEKQNPRH
jgi:hypothetical protein